MPVLQDRVQETTTTGGTGTIALAGAVTGYRSFNASFTIGDITYYTIDNGNGEWEIGVGTVGSGTLSRDSVLESSNANALVNFSAGTKRVFCSAPTKVLLPNQTSNSGKVLTTNGVDPAWTTTLNGITLGNITPGSGAFTTLSASSTVSGTGFSTYLASPPAIGGTTPAAGNFTTLGATGNVTLGDANTDTLTINGTAVSIPNNLNFDSNTLFIDATNNNVGINTASPGAKLHIISGGNPAAIFQSTSVATAGIEIRDGAATPNRWWLMSGLGSTTDGIFSIYDARQNLSRLAIDTPGNVGIGTSSPGYKLDVSSVGSAATETSLRLNNPYTSGTAVAATNILFSYHSGPSYRNAAKIEAGQNIAGSFASGYLAFFTQSSDSALTEAVRINNLGNVGIGTSSPGYKLDVTGTIRSNAASNGYAFLVDNGTYSGGLIPSTATGGLILYNAVAQPLGFWTNNVERMRIDSSGNVGIGTSSPGSLFGEKLGVYGAIAMRNNTDAITAFINAYSGASWFGSYSNHALNLVTNNVSRAIIDTSGNLGLGVTPGTRFDVSGGAGGSRVQLALSSAEMAYYAVNAANSAYASATWRAASHAYFIGATQAMTLTAGNNLLLGGTSDPGGSICMYIANRATVPGTPSGGGVIYVEAGALKYKGSSGTITTLGAA